MLTTANQVCTFKIVDKLVSYDALESPDYVGSQGDRSVIGGVSTYGNLSCRPELRTVIFKVQER